MSLSVDITRRFGDFELCVQFETDGGTLGIFCASGSGKSLTLKCIAGLETPDAGRVALCGHTLYHAKEKINLRPQQRRVGYLFQNYALFPNMTVAGNIAAALPKKRPGRSEAVAALVRAYRLDGLERQLPAQLSGGQQQRVALARTLAAQPNALLLDEPFSALDAYLKEVLLVEMAALLSGYAGDAVLVTHDRDEVFELCENLVVLKAGRVLAAGKTRALFAQPGHVEVARLTGCKNFSRAQRAGPHSVHAADWGALLHCDAPVPEDVTHVGVRAHSFFAAGASCENALAVRQTAAMEGPFEWNVLFEAGPAPQGRVWWKVPKTGAAGPPGQPAFLAVAPRDVLLLRGGDV